VAAVSESGSAFDKRKGPDVAAPRAAQQDRRPGGDMSMRNIVLVLVMATGLLTACTSTKIGGVHSSREVTEQFEKLAALPNYRYWYLNQENNPFGVVGLEREYRLDEDPTWQAVAPDSETFRKVVGLVQSFPMPGSFTSGFTITDPEGRQIGHWYSSLSAGIIVEPQTKIVSITTIKPWIFNEHF
jgi:hypothetical protein